MCFTRFDYRRETIRAISKMNRVLKTHFSYVLCIEEIDVLKQIPPKKDTTNKTRLEHLSQVFGLWNKGIKEEFHYYNKSMRNYEKIKPLFNNFVACFVYELYCMKILDDYDSKLDYSIESDYYRIKYNEYDYETKKQKLDDIDSLIELLSAFKEKLKHRDYPVYKEEILNTYLSLDYYGPMSIYRGYKRIKKSSENYDTISKSNPYNKLKRYWFNIGYSLLQGGRSDRLAYNKKLYRTTQLKLEKRRLEIEKSRINNDDKRYDFYFDYFIWRLNFDLEYIFLKQLGGIRKVTELVNIYLKDKSKKVLDQGPIEVDVDRMTIIDKKDNKSSGGGRKKSNPLAIKDFDNIEKEIRFRKEQKIIQREAQERKR